MSKEEMYFVVDPEERQMDLVYAAAIIDGEGTITLQRKVYKTVDTFGNPRKKRHPYLSPCVKVGNTDIRLTDWLYTQFGGSVYRHCDGVDRHKHVFHWYLSGEDATDFVISIHPYLKLKQERADILIAYKNLRKAFHVSRGRRAPEEFVEQASVLDEAMTILNKRGTE